MPDTRPGILAIFNNVAPGREAELRRGSSANHTVHDGPTRSGAGRLSGNVPSACSAACMATT